MLNDFNANPTFLETPVGRVAFHHLSGSPKNPTVLFLHGLGSDMNGGKIEAGWAWCAQHHVPALRLDYPGHGASGGAFVNFTLSQALDAIDALLAAKGVEKFVPVGASTGGWLTLLLAEKYPSRVVGVVSLCNGLDFTETLYWQPLSAEKQAAWQRTGVYEEPTSDGGTWQLGYGLIEDGRQHLMNGAERLEKLTCPLRLLHGMADDVVPWTYSTDVAHQWGGDDVVVELLKDCGHRLNEPHAVAAVVRLLASLPVWAHEHR